MNKKIEIQLPAWNVREMFGYEPQTTYWQDFSIADAFGAAAVRDTFKRAVPQAKKFGVVYYAELVMVLNHKIWQHYDHNDELARLYDELWQAADYWGCENYTGDDGCYYFETLD